MRRGFSKGFRLSIAALVGILSNGCAGAPHVPETDGIVASAGASIVPGHILAEYTETPTVSLALDRIDQRNLPLDRIYRHFGTGLGVTVYVFDGGILESHPDLAGRVREGYNAFPNEERICNPHGTAVAGAVAGSTLGVASSAEIVDVKMVECRKMRGTIDAIVRATKWVIQDHERHPQHRAIANWSFVADTAAAVPALDSAVAQLVAAGIPVVVSAGNLETDACHVSPANAPGAIVVGASRVRRLGSGMLASIVDQRAPGTAYGNCINVFAPGDSVMLPSIDSAQRPTQQLWNGTSMAAGYVSGAIALFLEAHPLATPDGVMRHVMLGATESPIVDGRSPRAGILYIGP
jgi:subtilisin family serine protease